ncbi:hypothetical protein V9T40_005751 [Parthenolecanium corni]|uniref:Nose resistant-to-fluoxetine protein N-terminal domain-containing protein n=1 Tax=Parthenolecanium corni TaxID=536013 RepID=A0AAN9YBB4_9HEMI
MESTQWPSVGVFAGTVDHFGNFDECLVISSHGVKGQYCLARGKYSIIDSSKFPREPILTEKVHQEASVWSAIESYLKNPVRVDRHILNWALCLPSSCRNEDLSMSLNSTLQPIFRKHGLNISVDVEPKFCHVREEHSYPIGYYLTMSKVNSYRVDNMHQNVYEYENVLARRTAQNSKKQREGGWENNTTKNQTDSPSPTTTK